MNMKNKNSLTLNLRLQNIKLGFQICFSKKRAKNYQDLVEAIISSREEGRILMKRQIELEETRQILLDRIKNEDGLYPWSPLTSKEQKNTPSKKYSKATESKSLEVNLSYETKEHQAVQYITIGGTTTETNQGETQ